MRPKWSFMNHINDSYSFNVQFCTFLYSGTVIELVFYDRTAKDFLNVSF